jgi:hypothetical protein
MPFVNSISGSKGFGRGSKPLIPIDRFFNYNTLLLSGDGANGAQNNTFLDSSTNNFTITRTGNVTQGSLSPFSRPDGQWSVWFDGNYDVVKLASDASFNLGTGNFTIEMWVNFDDYFSTQARLAGQYTSGNTNGWQIYKDANSWNLKFNTNSGDHVSFAWTGIQLGIWYHVAVVRSGTGANQTVMYINGIAVASGTCSHSVGANQLIVGGLDWAANYSVKGHISNFRYSNIARTITVPTVPYSSDANTLALLCQSNRFVEKSSNKAVTVGETPVIAPYSPFSVTTTYSPSVNGGSAYFDGTGDYLTVPDNSAFDFGTSPFTIELWFRSNPNRGLYDRMVAGGTDANGANNQWFLGFWPGAQINFGYQNGGGYTETAFNVVSIPNNAWNHVAIVRDGANVNCYFNGTFRGAWNVGAGVAFNTGAAGIIIGARYSFGTPIELWNGYISNLRIVKGTALYSTNFTPSTTPFASISGTSLLCNFTNAGIFDSAGNTVIENESGTQISTSLVKYGGGSLTFDGVDDALKILPSTSYAFGTGDFTVEAWVYPNNFNSGGIHAVLTITNSSGNGIFEIYRLPSNVISLWSPSGSVASSTDFINNQWQHIAVARQDGVARIFLNGTQIASGSYSQDVTYGGIAYIGRWTSGEYWKGNMDEFRVTKGIARYTANFTPPTRAFPKNQLGTELPYTTEGLIFDWDPAALDLSNGATIANSTSLNAGLTANTVSGTDIFVNNGTPNYHTGQGGHIDTTSNTCRISVTGTNIANALNASSSMTITCWFQGNGASRQVLISRYGSGFPDQFNHIVDPTGDFHSNSTGAIAGTSLDYNFNAWNNNTWHLCHFVYSVSDGIARWYVDGVQVGTSTWGTDSGNGLTISSSAGFGIMSRADDFERLVGRMGPVRIHNIALTPTQINNDWTAQRSRFMV